MYLVELVSLQLQETLDTWIKLLLMLHFDSYTYSNHLKRHSQTLILGLNNSYHAHWLHQPIPNFSEIF